MGFDPPSTSTTAGDDVPSFLQAGCRDLVWKFNRLDKQRTQMVNLHSPDSVGFVMN